MGEDAWDLMGTAEVAAHLGVSRQRVLQLLSEQDDFPQPVALLRMGKVWHAPEVRAWADRRRTSRPEPHRAGTPHGGPGRPTR